MKIDVNNVLLDSSNIDRTTLHQTKQSANSEPRAEAAQNEDAASLTLNHTDLKYLESQAVSAPAIRQDRVDALRHAIASGEYRTAPDQIAGAMIQDSNTLERQ